MHIDSFKKPLLTAALAAVGALGLTPAMAANIVTNGGFETGDLTGWSGTVLSNPYSGVICLGAGSVAEGSCELFLGTNGASSTVSQVLGTVAGQSYAVSFSFKTDGSGAPNSFSVDFGNSSLYNVVNATSTTAQTFTFTGSAVGAATALVFNFKNDPGYFFLDAVSVSAVPEPQTFALAAVGLVGLLARRRVALRRR